MLDWTDRYCRYFHRLITRRTLLYTEMVSVGALLHGPSERFLAFDPIEHPVALQLGGSEPADLARCARMGERHGYDEINLNIGCPSDRVQTGRFGACLMAQPDLVADGVKAMRDTVDVPVTVKHRLGIDDRDSYQALCDFIGTVAAAGCRTFIVHARKAWLQGLSPKENREIPPLRYDLVHRLKQDFPQLEIVLNGGLTSLQACAEHLLKVDGTMIGRGAYHQPWVLSEADHLLFGAPRQEISRHQIIERLVPFAERELAGGTPLIRITRHILGLFHGCPGARAWRRYLSENAGRQGADSRVLLTAARLVESS